MDGIFQTDVHLQISTYETTRAQKDMRDRRRYGTPFVLTSAKIVDGDTVKRMPYTLVLAIGSRSYDRPTKKQNSTLGNSTNVSFIGAAVQDVGVLTYTLYTTGIPVVIYPWQFQGVRNRRRT